MSTPNYLILSCDGGGIRGLITALLLQDLVNDPQTSGLLERVDLFAGTSTGGILSLALASGLPVSKIVDLYQQQGPSIFQPTQISFEELYRILCEFLPLPPLSAGVLGQAELAGPLHFLGDLVNKLKEVVVARYEHSGLKALLQSLYGADKTLADLSRKVLVTTLQLSDGTSWQPLVLTNLDGAPEASRATLLVDAALCTGAAPTYFPPYPHPAYGYCSDGGMFANNPSNLALTTLCDHGVAPEQVLMLSLGTGSSVADIPAAAINYYGPQSYGALLWMSPTARHGAPPMPLLDAVMDNVAQNDADEAGLILGERYQRGNMTLTQSISLDDYSPAAIQAMTEAANNYIASVEWQQLKRQVGAWLQTSPSGH